MALSVFSVVLTATAQNPAVQPSVELSIITLEFIQLERIELAIKSLTVEQIKTLAAELNANALFEGRELTRLTKHKTGPENYLYAQIKMIRAMYKTDPDKAREMIGVIVARFKSWGVEL
jgi:hypothetical protein